MKLLSVSNDAEALRLQLETASRRFAAIARLLQVYPRPSADANARLIIDAYEIAKASSIEIQFNLEPK